LKKFVDERKKNNEPVNMYAYFTRSYGNSFKGFYEKTTPLTSLTHDLLKALKEDLISELIIISSF